MIAGSSASCTSTDQLWPVLVVAAQMHGSTLMLCSIASRLTVRAGRGLCS